MKIALGVAIAFAITFFYYAYRMSLQNLELKDIIMNRFASMHNDHDKIAEESFLKFISESRDWAFQYIEEVQKAVSDFDKAVKKDIEYFEQYGDILGTSVPHFKSLQNISTAYKELMKVLPRDNDDQIEKP